MSSADWFNQYVRDVPWFVGFALGCLAGDLGLALPLNTFNQVTASLGFLLFGLMAYAALERMTRHGSRGQ